MATITKAMQKAGIPLPPTNRRIWQWCRDKNKRHTANEVAKALNILPNNASSVLGQLRDRNMMIVTVEFSKALGHNISYYETNPKMKMFELLPITKAAKERVQNKRLKKAAATSDKGFVEAGVAHILSREVAPVPANLTAPVASDAPAEITNKAHILDKISVREAFELYKELRAMFNPVLPELAQVPSKG